MSLKFEWNPSGPQKAYDGIYEDWVTCGLWKCGFIHFYIDGRYSVGFRMIGFGHCLVKQDAHHTAIETPYPAVELECSGWEYHALIESFITWFLDGTTEVFEYEAPDGQNRHVDTARRPSLTPAMIRRQRRSIWKSD